MNQEISPRDHPESLQIIIRPGDSITERMTPVDPQYRSEFKKMLEKILIPQADMSKSFLENYRAKRRVLGDVNDTGYIVWAYVTPDGKMEAFYGPERPVSGGRELKNRP